MILICVDPQIQGGRAGYIVAGEGLDRPGTVGSVFGIRCAFGAPSTDPRRPCPRTRPKPTPDHFDHGDTNYGDTNYVD